MKKTKRAGAKANTENSHSYSLRIEASFGSEFQRTVAVRGLAKLLASWKALVEERHKENAIYDRRGDSASLDEHSKVGI